MDMTAQEFDFLGYDLSEIEGKASFHYRLLWQEATSLRPKELIFTEVFLFGENKNWDSLSKEMLKILYLLAGVSYYKAGLAGRIDFGDIAVGNQEVALIQSVYSSGLYELAYRNKYRLPELSFYQNGNKINPVPVPGEYQAENKKILPTASHEDDAGFSSARTSDGKSQIKVLLPFGGGIDSVTSLELLRGNTDQITLFVMNKIGDTYDALENVLKVANLPVVRTERQLDAKILRSKELNLINGHVPITAVISAAAVLAAALTDHNHVIMSNEKSASSGSLTEDGVSVNHQWSKGIEFESIFNTLVKNISQDRIKYFSLLRSASELWVAKRFKDLKNYLPVFRSCNRAFHVDKEQRLDKWCGVCDKCCFIDLILAPFLTKIELEEIFAGNEPLANYDNKDRFLSLIGHPDYTKPFECVGDVTECRAALMAAAKRHDRIGDIILQELADFIETGDILEGRSDFSEESLMEISGPDYIPEYLRYVLD